MTSKNITEKPMVSLIIPAWRDLSGKENNIKTLLDSIPGNITLPCEIIVVCNSSCQAVIEVISQHQVVTRYCINSVNVGVSRAWNMGAHLAEGKFLCFVNEDVILGPGTIDTLAETLEPRPKVAVIGVEGANFDLQANGNLALRQRILKGPPQYCDALKGFLFMVRADIFHHLGGFDDALSPCFDEEIDFALRVRAAGLKSFVVPGLAYEHPWGVSAGNPRRIIQYLGRQGVLQEIEQRNRKLVVAKWRDQLPIISVASSMDFQGDYYGQDYFAQNNYIQRMTQPLTIRGREEQPLSLTLADMVEAVAFQWGRQPCRTLELGCGYGYTVQELLKRGYEAAGMDFSQHCIANSPVKERLQLQDVRSLPADKNFDIVIATNLFEHLSDSDACTVIKRTAKIGKIFFTIINKSRHDPSHINLKSNSQWIKLFHEFGFYFHPGLTRIARKEYLDKSIGPERWHRDCLIFSLGESDGIPGSIYWRMSLVKEAVMDAADLFYARLSSAKQSLKRCVRAYLQYFS